MGRRRRKAAAAEAPAAPPLPDLPPLPALEGPPPAPLPDLAPLPELPPAAPLPDLPAPAEAPQPVPSEADAYSEMWAKRTEKPLQQVYGHIDRRTNKEAGSLLDRYADRFGHELDREIIVLRKQISRSGTPHFDYVITPAASHIEGISFHSLFPILIDSV